jgi:RNA polymerase sigma factor (sigma-70 family)
MSTLADNARSRFEQDAELLRQFVQQGSQQAFATLMRHHLPFVYATCKRELNNAEMAQDAAQVVFLILARKASTLRNRTALAAWLFQTARFVSQDIRKKEQRRMFQEQQILQQSIPTQQSHEMLWNQIDPMLNRTLAALNRVERDAILLHYMDGMTLRETSAALGLTEGAARMRISRALEKMRRYLGKAGVTLSVATLAVVLEKGRAYAALQPPETLSRLISEQAGDMLMQTLAAPRTVQLAQGVQRTMQTRIWRSAATITVSVAVIIGGVKLVRSHPRPHLPGRPVATRVAPTVASAPDNFVAPPALANLTLPNNSALTFEVAWRDLRTPAMRQQMLDSQRARDRARVQRGQMTQQQADDAFAQIQQAMQREPRAYQYDVTLSIRDGKLLLLSDRVPDAVDLPIAYVYDGESCMTLYRLPGENQANIGHGMYLQETNALLPLPGLDLPSIPLFKMPPGRKPLHAPANGQTLILHGEALEPFVARAAEESPMPLYYEGQLHVRWKQGQPQALELRTYNSDIVNGIRKNTRIMSKWEFAGHRLFQGVWLATRIRDTEYDRQARPYFAREFSLRTADPTPLPAEQFSLASYLAREATRVQDYSPHQTTSFSYDARRGTLEEQTVQAYRINTIPTR